MSAISQHSKNLLEAFKHSNPPPPTPATPTPKPVAAQPSAPTPVVAPITSGTSGAPAAATPAAAPRAASAPQATGATNAGGLPPRRSNAPKFASPIALIVAAQVVLLVGAFFLGRWSKSFGDGVEAKGPADRVSLESALGDTSTSVVQPNLAPNNDTAGLLARPQNMTAADAALLDTRNRYTVKAIQYDANERSFALAKEVCAHFARRSLPVCTPYQRGGSLSILVGAAANTADLEELQRAVKSIDSPNGTKGEFASAYIAPIDSVVKRNH